VSGPSYPLGIIGTVPRAYYILRPMNGKHKHKGMNKQENLIQNIIQDFKNTSFSKTKIPL
jgi:hypothetical protein